MHQILQMTNAAKREQDASVQMQNVKNDPCMTFYRAWLWYDLKYYNQAGPNVLFISTAWDVGAQLTSHLRNSIAIGFSSLSAAWTT